MPPFDYNTAFSRNIGWLTQAEQDRLRNARNVIACMGGIHLLTLCRLGIGKFHLIDFNRQAGATFSPLNLGKLEVIIRRARGINSGLDIKNFPRSVVSSNLSGFFTDVALYMYGLCFLAFEARRVAFTGCTWRHDGDRNPLQQFVLAAGATPTRCHDAPKFIMST